MKVPELLVEYLIIGSCALVWLFSLFTLLGIMPNTADISTLAVAVLVPCLYVLGMMIDSAAHFVFKRKIESIRWSIVKEFGVAEDIARKCFGHEAETRFTVYQPELLKAVQMRSSRDRIARSTIVNLLFATFTLSIHDLKHSTSWPIILGQAMVLLFVVIFSWRMWIRYQYLSFHYEIVAYQALDEKLRRNLKSEE